MDKDTDTDTRTDTNTDLDIEADIAIGSCLSVDRLCLLQKFLERLERDPQMLDRDR